MHSRLTFRVLVTIGLLLTTTPALAISYTSNGSGAWNTPATWAPGGIPGAGDSATIQAGHTVTLDSARSIANVTVNGTLNLLTFTLAAVNAPSITGTISGAGGALTISGTGNWTAGVLNAAILNVLSGASLTISGSAKTMQSSAQLVAGGTVNWTGGQILNNTTSLINIQPGGVFDAQSNDSIASNSGAGSITNAGTFRKTGGGGTTTIGSTVPLTTSGRIEASSGNIDAQTHTLNGATIGDGFSITSGTTTIASNSSVEPGATMTMNGGTLTGSADLAVHGTLQWNGGTMNGAGASVTIPAGKILTLGTAATKTMQNSFQLHVAGTLNWLDGQILLNTSSLLDIQSGGVFDAQGNDQIANNSGAGSITSSGTFKKTGGASIQIVSGVPFNNSGRIEELSGTINAQTLNLNAGSVLAGLTVSSGTTSILGASSLEAGTTMTVSGGTLGGSSTLTVNGTLNFTGGTMNGGATVDVVVGANLNFDSGSTKTLSNGFDLNVFGTATWIDGQILLNTTSRLDVQAGGTLDIQTNNSVANNSGAGSISSSGTILKSAGGGATSVVSAVPVFSDGTIDIQSGTFSAGNLTLGTGTLILGNGFTVNSGTTSVTGTSTVDAGATMTLATGGVLSGTFPLTVNGTLEWTGGTMNGAGASANLTSGGALNLSGGATKTLSNGFDLNIAGLATWTGGTLLLNTGSLLNIQGSGIFDAQGTNSIANNSGAGSIANSGIFRKSTGGGVTTIVAAVPFVHNNRIEIPSGTTNFQALTLNAGSVIAGIGFTLASGTTTIAGASSVENGAMMTFSGGTLAGTSDLTIDGTLLWTGGTMSGAGGSVTLPASRTMTISGGTKTMQNSFVLNVAGTVAWTSGTILLNTSSLLNIQAGGVFDVQSDNQIANNSGNGSIANNSTFKKTGGAGTMTITAGVPFSNNARIEIASGTSDIQALTLNTGSVLAGSGFTIINGVTTLAGPSTAETGSSITLAGGTLNGTSSLTIDGTLDWTGGTMNGNASVIVPAAGVINISGAGTKTLSNGFDLLNAGTINWTGGNILDNTAALIDNQSGGLFLIETDNLITNNSGNGTITNSGTLRKLTTTGTTTIVGGVPFTNSGTVDVQLGKLQLTNPSFAGTTILNFGISGATPLTGYGVLGITGAVAFNGTIDVDVPGPYSPMGGDQFAVITYTSHSGTLAESLAFETARTFTTTYNPTNLTLTASCSPPSPNVSASATSFCTGDSVTLTSSPTGGTAPYTYQWYEGVTLLGGETAANLVVTAGGNYSVIVSDAVACDAQSPSTTITENPAAVVSISGPASVCPNVSFSLDAGAGFTGYAWSTGQTSQIILVSQVVSTTYNVTVTNASGCQATDSHVVAITANPDATISAPASVPPNATGIIASAPLQGSASYAWTIANGTITGGQGTNSITFDAPSGGVISLQLTVTISGCTATGTAYVSTEETDIAIAKTAAATVQAGASLVYTIDVANLGSFPSNGVTVVDSLPAGTTLASINPGPWDCSEFGNDVTCVGDLAPDTSSAITLTITAPQQPGTITNSALVISTNDPNSENNSASATTTVTAPTDCATVPPTLLTPADNATNLPSPVTFSWSEVGGALSYEVWLISGGASSLLASTTATTLAAGVPSGAYRWFVIATMAVGCNPLVSVERGFTIDTSDDSCASRSVAFPIAPSNNSIVNTSSVTFHWNPALNADGYRVWAAIDGAAPAILGTTDETSLLAHIVKGEILWWVEALYDGCASTESQRFHFTIPPKQNCGNARPELIAPATGANVTDGSVTFFWHGVDDAVGYEVYLAAGSGTPVLIGNTSAATTSLSHLVPPGELEWTVLANIDRCPSRESQKSNFTFTPPADCIDYQRPILVSPLDDIVTTSPTLFSWNAVAGATLYELYIVRETNAVLVATTTATSLSDVQLASGNVRWFVRAYFSEPCAPLDSEERELEVVALPAACGELEAPVIAAPGQISSGVPFLVQWTPSIGATHYELEVAANNDFAGAELITTSATQQELVRTNNGASPLSLFARVRAIDARCTPNPAISADGPVSAIFILPTGGANGTAPAGSGGTISFTIPLDAQFAGQSFTAEPGVPWLSVSPSSGVVGANGTLLTAVASTTDLPIGASLGSVTVTFNTLDSGSVQTHGTTLSIPTISISLVTPVTPTLNTTPPPDALIIPAVAHANGINTTFQSDVRVSNTSPKLLKYRLTFTPSGSTGITSGRQTTFSVEPGHTIALDDILASWFGTGESSAIGMLEIRPLTETTTSTSSVSRTGLANLVTFASSRTFSVTPNGTFGQYIPAIPFANFLGRALDPSKPTLLSLQQIAQSDRYRTNLGLVEASGEPASLLVRVFGGLGEQLTAFPVNLAGGEHTQLNAFLAQQGINSLSDGRVEIEVLSAGGKVTAYASVLDNDTNDSLLVTPVTINDTGASHWVIPGVADLNNGFANWQTDMRVFNAGTEDVDATLSFYSQNGGEPRTASITIPAGRVRQFDKSLASLFNVTNDGGAIHIDTGSAARLITTARTYNETTSGTFGQFISAITPLEAAGIESRPLQLLQVEESSRYRSNIGMAEVTGNPVKLEISIVPPDAKLTAITELTLAPNEFRQIGSMLKAVGLDETFNARISIRVIEGSGRVTAYVSVIDAITNDPTYLPAQ